MNKQHIKDVVVDQQNLHLQISSVPREALAKVHQAQKTKQIMIITGLRRCGKSTLMQQVRQHAPEQHYFINFDDERLLHFSVEDFQTLLEIFGELYDDQTTFYFDEIQNIHGWERFVRRLHDQGNTIYITGSNATMFSRELGTHLTGRYVQIELYPFSFREFLVYKNELLSHTQAFTTKEKARMKKLFLEYCVAGGIPGYCTTKQVDYLQYLYESIVYRDIIARYHISDEKVIKELLYYLASNIGKEVSYNNLKKMVGIGSTTTISEYCGYFENSFLTFFVNRYDYSLRKQINYHKKEYCIDTALAKAIGFQMSEDRGRMLENVVFLELKRRQKNVYFHQRTKECDFLIRQGGTIEDAIQVTTHLDSPETKQREVEGLLDALTTYKLRKGYILTEDNEATEHIMVNRKKYTIEMVPIWKWLLETR